MEKSITKRQPLQKEVTASPTPLTLLTAAIEKGVDMQQLKELMDLQERWEKKEAKKAFLDALSKFQTLVPVVKKNKKASIASQKGSFSYKFAELGVIAATIKEALNASGLSYRWEFKESAGKLKVTCLVSHRDGHTESTEMEAGLDTSGYKNDIQQKGSTHSYLQRYTLIGALGLSTADEDNDGKDHPTTPLPQSPPALTEEEILDQWSQKVKEVKSRIELTGLYLKNRKTIDANEKIQAIFKSRQEELPDVKNQKVTLP